MYARPSVMQSSQLAEEIICQQDCIPVGCIPSACRPYLPARSVQGEVSLPGGFSLPWGGSPWWGGYPAFTEAGPPHVNRITDACENITLPQMLTRCLRSGWGAIFRLGFAPPPVTATSHGGLRQFVFPKGYRFVDQALLHWLLGHL